MPDVEIYLKKAYFVMEANNRKKRVSRITNQATSSSNDLVKDIVESMDNPRKNIITYKELEEYRTRQQQKNNVSEVNDYNNCSSKGFMPQKSFPLMKKCQNNLRHLKRNMRVPKPRAHLNPLSKLSRKEILTLGNISSLFDNKISQTMSGYKIPKKPRKENFTVPKEDRDNLPVVHEAIQKSKADKNADLSAKLVTKSKLNSKAKQSDDFESKNETECRTPSSSDESDFEVFIKTHKRRVIESDDSQESDTKHCKRSPKKRKLPGRVLRNRKVVLADSESDDERSCNKNEVLKELPTTSCDKFLRSKSKLNVNASSTKTVIGNLESYDDGLASSFKVKENISKSENEQSINKDMSKLTKEQNKNYDVVVDNVSSVVDSCETAGGDNSCDSSDTEIDEHPVLGISDSVTQSESDEEECQIIDIIPAKNSAQSSVLGSQVVGEISLPVITSIYSLHSSFQESPKCDSGIEDSSLSNIIQDNNDSDVEILDYELFKTNLVNKNSSRLCNDLNQTSSDEKKECKISIPNLDSLLSKIDFNVVKKVLDSEISPESISSGIQCSLGHTIIPKKNSADENCKNNKVNSVLLTNEPSKSHDTLHREESPYTPNEQITRLHNLYSEEYQKFKNLKCAPESMSQGKALLEEQERKLLEIRREIKILMKAQLGVRNLRKAQINSSVCQMSSTFTAADQAYECSKIIKPSEAILDHHLGNRLNSVTHEHLTENKKVIQYLINRRCAECGKQAVAACQGCAKEFYCSAQCGAKAWEKGHYLQCKK